MENRKKYVYICSPLSGDIRSNMAKARRYCEFAFRQGVIPMAPHIYFPQFMNDDVPSEREVCVEEGTKWLEVSDELWVFGERISPGMSAELGIAESRGMPIRYFKDTFMEWEGPGYFV